MQKTIKLINSKNGWLARFEGDKRIISLFGTDTLPTPFTEKALPMEVLEVIQEKNPNHRVIFA